MFPYQNLLENTAALLAELPLLYARMDAAYARIADVHGFHCSGCEENCCLTLFFHHTLAEYLYLMKGFMTLDPEMQDQIAGRAARVNLLVEEAVGAGETSRVMCPVNVDGLCVLYEYRPMICRLHGIAHEFRHPSGKMVSGPGCAAFESRRNPSADPVLDRTPFYRDMAARESRIRQATGIRDRFKMTVAQMLTPAGRDFHETC